MYRTSRSGISANDKIIFGLIGAGGRGTRLILDLVHGNPEVEVKYVCDVDAARGGRAINELENMQGFRPIRKEDMREVYDDKEVDAVLIATPEHWHALAFIWACQAGKDVFIEKVISMSIFEGIKMIEATQKYNRIVQCGTQNRSADFAFSARDYIKEGKLGKIIKVKTYCILPGESPFHLRPDSPVPEGLNWDLWLGPARMIPYNIGRHKAPYDWWDYSPGLQQAMNTHVVDFARMVIGDPDDPLSVHCTGGRVLFDDDKDIPDMQIATFDFGDLVMTSESGVFGNYMYKSPPEVRFGDIFPDWRVTSTRTEIYGTEGLMLLEIMGGGWIVIDNEGKIREKELGYFPDEAHLKDFVTCLKTRTTPNSDIIQGHKSSVLIHLANLSYRTGNQHLLYDGKKGIIKNSEEANIIDRGFYRTAYNIPDVV